MCNSRDCIKGAIVAIFAGTLRGDGYFARSNIGEFWRIGRRSETNKQVAKANDRALAQSAHANLLLPADRSPAHPCFAGRLLGALGPGRRESKRALECSQISR